MNYTVVIKARILGPSPNELNLLDGYLWLQKELCEAAVKRVVERMPGLARVLAIESDIHFDAETRHVA